MEKKALFYGIIHIGSSNLSLRIVEYKNIDNINIDDNIKIILYDGNFNAKVTEKRAD